jgi:hypothetical protein
LPSLNRAVCRRYTRRHSSTAAESHAFPHTCASDLVGTTPRLQFCRTPSLNNSQLDPRKSLATVEVGLVGRGGEKGPRHERIGDRGGVGNSRQQVQPGSREEHENAGPRRTLGLFPFGGHGHAVSARLAGGRAQVLSTRPALRVRGPTDRDLNRRWAVGAA